MTIGEFCSRNVVVVEKDAGIVELANSCASSM